MDFSLLNAFHPGFHESQYLLRPFSKVLMKLVYRLNQQVNMLKVMIVSHTTPQMSPDILLRIEFRRILGKPLDLGAVIELVCLAICDAIFAVVQF